MKLFNQEEKQLAVATLYSEPHAGLLAASSKTYFSVGYVRDRDIVAFDIRAIQAVVMIAPDPQYKKGLRNDTGDDRFYVMEKPGLSLWSLNGVPSEPVVEEV